MEKTLAERFEEKVARGEGGIPAHCPELGPCDLWTAGTDPQGYGRINIKKVPELAHRVSFFLSDGRWPLPCCLHHCDNPSCVRRSHLFEGTKADNIADMDAKGRSRRDITAALLVPSYQARKTHCPKGHPYEGSNLRICGGKRVCVECARANLRRSRARRVGDSETVS